MALQPKIKALISFFLILSQVSLMDWQGTGNLTQSNLTIIWTVIKDNMDNFVTEDQTDLPLFATFISKALNEVWSPAWNVFVFELFDPSVDAVVYGYAFRDHWMWFNDFKFNNRSFSFVIWKDYNCKEWHTVDDSMIQPLREVGGPNNQIMSSISTAVAIIQDENATSINTYEDIWKVMFLIVETMQTQTPNKAYTAVGIQSGFSEYREANKMNGHFCSDGGPASFLFTVLINVPSQNNQVGIFKVLIIETRSS